MLETLTLALRMLVASLVAVLVYWFDEPLTGYDLVWWVCAIIGIAFVMGFWLVFVVIDDA